MEALELIAEIQKRALVKSAESKSWVVDGGFFKGKFARKAIQNLESVQCVGFEPNRKLFEQWQASSFSKNECITLENSALGSQCGEASYFSNDFFPATNSLLPRPLSATSVDPYYPREAVLKKENENVNIISLDQYFCSLLTEFSAPRTPQFLLNRT